MDAESMGMSELHSLKAVASVITHELLVEASDAVSAINGSGRLRLKLLSQVVAAAVGGSIENDDALKLKVGKRLSARSNTS